MSRPAVIGGSLALVGCAAVIAWLQAGPGIRRVPDAPTVARAAPASPATPVRDEIFHAD